MNSIMYTISKDPFRLYFPFAISFVFYASWLWVDFGLLGRGEYPGAPHAELFIGGFIYLAILGFLMTAIPRFTKTDYLAPVEVKMSMLLIATLIVNAVLGYNVAYWGTISAGWVMLFLFAFKRFTKRKENPPSTFLFVGVGILLGFLGSVLILGDQLAIGRLFFYDGMVLSLILGVGGRLIPGILGHRDVVAEQRAVYEQPLPFYKVVPLGVYMSAISFVASLLVEAFINDRIAYTLRAFTITYIALRYWSIHKWPTEFRWHGFFLWMSSWFIFAASWLLVFNQEHVIHIKHLIYIGGYMLLTILVASRVILAHGTDGLSMEGRTFPHVYVAGSIIIGALTRATAFLIPGSYIRHLGYAGVCILIAFLIWITVFFPKIFKKAKTE